MLHFPNPSKSPLHQVGFSGVLQTTILTSQQTLFRDLFHAANTTNNKENSKFFRYFDFSLQSKVSMAIAELLVCSLMSDSINGRDEQ